MHKTLYLKPRLPLDARQLRKAQLARRNHAAHTKALVQLCGIRPGDCGLSACMQGKKREILVQQSQCAQILHNDGIQSCFVVGRDIVRQCQQLCLFEESIHCHMNTNAKAVRIAKSLYEICFPRILCIGSRAILRTADINCICARIDRYPETLN